MKYLVLGKSGQLASSFRDYFQNQDIDFISLGKEDLDLFSSDWQQKLKALEFDTIVNCMAFTAVDNAETNKESADLLNAEFPLKLAMIAKEKNSTLVHYSTDYVCDETDINLRIKENHPCKPVNYYGKSKLEGELNIQKILTKYFIFRTSWVFSQYGNNFVKTMLRLANEKDSLNVVKDQTGLPTFAGALAQYSFEIFSDNSSSYGTYNLSNNGPCNWAEFARSIIGKGANLGLCKNIPVHGIPSSEYPTPAKRPVANVFDLSKAESQIKKSLPHWQDSLDTVLNSLKNS
ncbi:MAG: dTDP-4-dehydrorhamnose reductase [Bdellovibrionota bacterium]|nr:dTDP-4-dehydrorhamnose reductase [Bdellovibrionota bacterium]